MKFELDLTTEQIEQIARKMVEISKEEDSQCKTEESKEVFLKVREAAEALNTSEQTVRKLIKEGFLKAVKLGSTRVSNKEIERYAKT